MARERDRERETDREKNGRLGFTKVLEFLGQIRILRGNLPLSESDGGKSVLRFKAWLLQAFWHFLLDLVGYITPHTAWSNEAHSS